MTDRLQQELNVLKGRRNAIKKDLHDLVVEMSATSQVVLMFELARIEANISEMQKELEDMAFEDFMREKWKD